MHLCTLKFAHPLTLVSPKHFVSGLCTLLSDMHHIDDSCVCTLSSPLTPLHWSYHAEYDTYLPCSYTHFFIQHLRFDWSPLIHSLGCFLLRSRYTETQSLDNTDTCFGPACSKCTDTDSQQYLVPCTSDTVCVLRAGLRAVMLIQAVRMLHVVICHCCDVLLSAEVITSTTNETVTNSTWVDTTDGSALDVAQSGMYIYGSNASTELVVDSGSEEVALNYSGFFSLFFLFFFFFFFLFSFFFRTEANSGKFVAHEQQCTKRVHCCQPGSAGGCIVYGVLNLFS